MNGEQKQKNSVLAWTLFILYCAVMLWLLFFRRVGRGRYTDYLEMLRWNLNLEPLQTIKGYLYVLRHSGEFGGNIRDAVINLAGNVVMFVPLGILPPIIWPRLRRLWRFAIFVVLTITAVELTQLLTLLGSCDIDDLLLNSVGALIGFGAFKLAALLRARADGGKAPRP